MSNLESNPQNDVERRISKEVSIDDLKNTVEFEDLENEIKTEEIYSMTLINKQCCID